MELWLFPFKDWMYSVVDSPIAVENNCKSSWYEETTLRCHVPNGQPILRWVSQWDGWLLRLPVKFGHFTANGSYHCIAISRNSFLRLTFFLQLTIKNLSIFTANRQIVLQNFRRLLHQFKSYVIFISKTFVAHL